jgi:beta-glucanase (GH16 family)
MRTQKYPIIIGLAVAAAIITTAVVATRDRPSAVAQSAERLDLSKYTLTFSDEFDTLDVSARGPKSRWTAHTPYGGDFGDAEFTDPTPGFPFTVDNGILRIQARKGDDGKWRSGLLSSRDPYGNGFAQQFGYFEIRAKLPEGPGVWPAFWLLGVNRGDRYPEVDVLEYYGRANYRFHSVLHVWDKDEKKGVGREQITEVEPNLLTKDFNTYGVDVSADWTTFYLNGVVIWKTKSEPEFAQPMYILINLALGSGWPIDETKNPSNMYVDYVRAYALK